MLISMSYYFRRMNTVRYNVARKLWIQFNPLLNAAEPMDLKIGPAANMENKILLKYASILAFQTPKTYSEYQNPAAKIQIAPPAVKDVR